MFKRRIVTEIAWRILRQDTQANSCVMVGCAVTCWGALSLLRSGTAAILVLFPGATPFESVSLVFAVLFGESQVVEKGVT